MGYWLIYQYTIPRLDLVSLSPPASGSIKLFLELIIDMDNVESSVPQYIQIADNLLDQIESGELAPGERLLSERSLSEMFEVNRLTLRKALSRLEKQGVIVRKHGKGNFIAEPRIERQTGHLVSFTNGIQRRGLAPGARLIAIEQEQVAASIAKQLGVPVLTMVYYIHRVRMINREPAMIEEVWIPVSCFPEIELHDLNKRSVHEIMDSEYGITIKRTQRSLEPVIATKSEAELLSIEGGAPLMLERRRGFDQKERCVEFGKDLYRGDRFRFLVSDVDL